MNGNYRINDIVLGDWRLVKLLGRGSFGTVYEAHKEEFGNIYKAAIKIMTVPFSETEIHSARSEGMDDETISDYFRSMVEEIVQEFALMSRLKGVPNIVSYYDHAVIPHTNGIGWDIFIRMELLEPLLVHMSRNKMTRRDIIQLGIDTCKALEICKRNNIIHRDLKPENMFVSELGEYKVGDFGVARVIADKTTGGLSKKGTYGYMAPEVYREDTYGPNIDIYALGIMLYRLLNYNRAPFLPLPPAEITHSDRELALIRRMSGEQFPPPALADERLADIVMKACAYDPKARYAEPAQLRYDLEKALYLGASSSKSKSTARHIDPTEVKKLYGSEVASVHNDKTILSRKETQNIKPQGTSKTSGTTVHGTYTSRTRGKFEATKDRTVRKSNESESGISGGMIIKFILLACCIFPVMVALVFGVNWMLQRLPFDNKEKVATISTHETSEVPMQSQDPVDTHVPETLIAAEPTVPETTVSETTPPTTLPPPPAPIVEVSAGESHVLALRSDGTVEVVGGWSDQESVSSWTDVIAISAGASHSVGLRSDGTVVAAGSNENSQCEVSSWTDIVEISASANVTAGLRSDGTIVTTAADCYELQHILSCTNIESVQAGRSHGDSLKAESARGNGDAYKNNAHVDYLTSDGTWVTYSRDGSRETIGNGYIALAEGEIYSIGLKSNGTVTAIQDEGYGLLTDPPNTSSWTDIVQVAAGGHVVGLKSDGTVVASGGGNIGNRNAVTEWTDIVSISASVMYTVGVRSDGTIVCTSDAFDFSELNAMMQ